MNLTLIIFMAICGFGLLGCCVFEFISFIKEINAKKHKKFLIISKECKALQIIKKKNIDVALFKECLCIDEYNKWCSNKSILTKKQYDLLKEVLS